MSEETHSASCLCGGVRWRIEGAPRQLTNCHCARCRKAHGSAFGTFALVRPERFAFVAGRELVERYESSPGNSRPFCRVCGSVVPDGVPWHGRVAMPAGPFDEDPGARIESELFVGSKAPWFDAPLTGAPFDAYPPGFDAPALEPLLREDPPARVARGSCLCNAVSFAVDGPVLRARHCHCSRCRKAMGAPFGSFLVTPLDGVRWVRGEEHARSYKVPEAKHYKHVFCDQCGSALPRFDPGRSIVVVPLGALDEDPGVRASAHIFVASKAPWYELTEDGLPRYDEYPPA